MYVYIHNMFIIQWCIYIYTVICMYLNIIIYIVKYTYFLIANDVHGDTYL